VNFIQCLALKGKILDDSLRLDVVEIARVLGMVPSLFLYWSGKGLISTPVLISIDIVTMCTEKSKYCLQVFLRVILS
jgi:hypothetical protein